MNRITKDFLRSLGSLTPPLAAPPTTSSASKVVAFPSRTLQPPGARRIRPSRCWRQMDIVCINPLPHENDSIPATLVTAA